MRFQHVLQTRTTSVIEWEQNCLIYLFIYFLPNPFWSLIWSPWPLLGSAFKIGRGVQNTLIRGVSNLQGIFIIEVNPMNRYLDYYHSPPPSTSYPLHPHQRPELLLQYTVWVFLLHLVHVGMSQLSTVIFISDTLPKFHITTLIILFQVRLLIWQHSPSSISSPFRARWSALYHITQRSPTNKRRHSAGEMYLSFT